MQGESASQLAGGIVAVVSFLVWALLPIYFNLIDSRVGPWEMYMHRIIWSCVTLFVFLGVMGRLATLTGLFRRKKTMLALSASAFVLFANWGVFIWAVTDGHIMDVSLGFFISPLLIVLLGACILKEKSSRLQMGAVALAAAGVLAAIAGFGFFPWIALFIGGTFALYGLIRKQVAVDSATGLLFETLLVMPLAIVSLIWLHANGNAGFLSLGWKVDFLLIGCGVFGVIPLVMFSYAARRISMQTLGFLQYISPTGHFISAVFLYGEAVKPGNAVAFVFIWLGLALYTFDLVFARRAAKREGRAQIAAVSPKN